MIHEPLIDGAVGGSATSIKNISESILETKKLIVDILVKHTGRSEEEVERALIYDNFMTSEKAVEFGICDEVVNKL